MKIKPTIGQNKCVHVPSENDLRNSDRYLLTSQEQGQQNELKTTLVKATFVNIIMQLYLSSF